VYPNQGYNSNAIREPAGQLTVTRHEVADPKDSGPAIQVKTQRSRCYRGLWCSRICDVLETREFLPSAGRRWGESGLDPSTFSEGDIGRSEAVPEATIDGDP
jgi:hypothetical protein